MATMSSHRRPGDRPLAPAACRDPRGRRPVLRRGLGDLRSRQCRRPGRGPARRPRRAADLAGPQRAGHGPCRHRLRQAVAARAGHGLHQLDRPRRDQHGHRRRPGPCQPPAGAVPARRRLCQPPARSGAAAGRGFRRRHDQRQRLLQAGVALFRPHHPARADPRRLPRALATMLDPATCGPATLAFCQDVQAEAFDYPESFFEKRVWRIRRAAARSARAGRAGRPDQGRQGAADRGRRRGALRPRRGGPGGPGLRHRPAGRRDPRRQGRLAWDHPRNLGSVGVTGSLGRQRRRRSRRPDRRDRHAAAGLHHRLAGPVRAPGRKLVQVNVAPHDAHKHGATSVVGDAGR
jgi:hypothetical protein